MIEIIVAILVFILVLIWLALRYVNKALPHEEDAERREVFEDEHIQGLPAPWNRRKK